jgi:short-subunit dehydrogenase
MEDKEHVVVITGASDGIGREVALRYAARKCRYPFFFFFFIDNYYFSVLRLLFFFSLMFDVRLVIAARSQQKLEEVKEQCVKRGADKCIIYPLDVSKQDECR